MDINLALPPKKIITQPVKVNDNFQYMNKFKSAVYASVLFIILSHKVSYKVLDLILKVFINNIEIIDENENPQILGTLIFAVLIALIIFIF